YTKPDKVFEKPLELGQKVLINDVKVEIIGFYEEIGSPQDDSSAYTTVEDYKKILNLKEENEYGYLVAQADDGTDPTEVSERIEHKLRRLKDEDKGKESFFVVTFQEYIEQFGTIIQVLNGVLVIIALISVIISAINIMNTMYTAVLERTKDIGIMKAIGARNSDITIIFVIESGMLGLIGGAIGVFLGYLIASGGGAIAASAGYSFLKPYFSPFLITGCLLFALIVGAGSGLAPAVQASKHKPVDSLRYE
ncbi:MAG: FtsX-like permease family protein, partial [Nanoarchaeota archaeon]|nr:FtsX-like permease family protein [Nanoarchaeota archaeon]MBU1854798.1 FtsX-like permease family protein [Nanoarchaeota archaeon]